MDQKKALSRLRHARTTYVGPITCQLLMVHYGTAGKALAAIPEKCGSVLAANQRRRRIIRNALYHSALPKIISYP